MVKTFKKNQDGKVEFTTEELKKLLDEIYWQGYNDNNAQWYYYTPNYTFLHKYNASDWCSITSDANSITLNTNLANSPESTTSNIQC